MPPDKIIWIIFCRFQKICFAPITVFSVFFKEFIISRQIFISILLFSFKDYMFILFVLEIIFKICFRNFNFKFINIAGLCFKKFVGLPFEYIKPINIILYWINRKKMVKSPCMNSSENLKLFDRSLTCAIAYLPQLKELDFSRIYRKEKIFFIF